MPYPVLPPPSPPPIVSNVASPQDAELVTVVPEDISEDGPGTGFESGSNSSSNSSSNFRGDRARSASLPPSSQPSDVTSSSQVDWATCLAPPERLPSESSSAFIADQSGSSDRSNFFCIPPQHPTRSLQPPSQQTQSFQPPPLQDIVVENHPVSLNAADLRLERPQRYYDDKPDDKVGARRIEIPKGTEIVEELRYVVETFNPTQFPPPSLRQLAQRQDGTSPDIFVIPLTENTPLIPDAANSEGIEINSDEIVPDRIDLEEILDPDVLDPKILDPEILDPEILDPDVLDSEILDPEILDPEILDPEILDSEILDPEILDPEILDPDVLDPEILDLEDSIPTDLPDRIEDLNIEGDDSPSTEINPEIPILDTPESGLDGADNADNADNAVGDTTDEISETSETEALEVTADRQIYDRVRQYFLAEGNALMTFRGALLQADSLRVNLHNQIVVAQGNAVLTRGDQVIRGDRLEYNLIQDQGTIFDAKGEVFLPQTSSDFGPSRPDTLDTSETIPLSDRLAADQPVVTASSPGGLQVGVGISGGQGNQSRQGAASGSVSRIRFEADEITFTPDGWDATNVRLTNDPFSPPELEIRSRLVTFRRLDANRSELRARRPRLVLDQWLHIPLLRERAIFDQRDRNPAPFQMGFDEDERGGFFIQRPFTLLALENVGLTLTPQYFVQRALENDDEPENLDDSSSLLDSDLFGLLGELDVRLGEKIALAGSMSLTSLDFEDNVNEDDLRGSVRLQRKIDTSLGPHVLTSEYSYRDRLFNGTLGFQTVQKSYGVVVTSPPITLGDSGIQLTYQGGIQRVNANIAADRVAELLPPIRANNRDTLMRYQVAADLRRTYFLWSGTPLPATQNEGLRYTPNPVVPYIALVPSVRGVASFYSSGDDQPILTGQLSLFGQFGHFSRPYLDYLGFDVSYRRSTDGPESPFDFDRVADREVLSGGLTAQLFGPIRLGIRTSISLNKDEEFDNSFVVEYSRRTHGLVLSYNPDRQIGTIGIRISDFNWNGTPEPFGGSGVRTVNDGVLRND